MTTTVLTIDDDPAITELLSVILKSNKFDVLVANSGEEGVSVIKDKNPNIVILDLMMPEMDGWEVCKAVRAFSNIPIIVLSALDNPSIVASILDAGADDYLVKPVTSAVLVAHINKLSRRTATDSLPNNSATFQTNTHPLTP